MSYETSIKKFQYLWEASQANEFALEVTRNKLTIFGQQVEQLAPRVLRINALTDMGGPYQDSTLVVDQLEGTFGTVGVLGVIWQVVCTNIPEAFLPFMRINIGYNIVGSIDPTGTSLQFCSTDSFVASDSNPDIGVATWSICFTYLQNQDNPSLTPDTGLKLYMVFLPPAINI